MLPLATNENQWQVDRRFHHNIFGFHDIQGDVLEWCQDYFDIEMKRTSLHVSDPNGPKAGVFRVSRGGNWAGTAGTNISDAKHKNVESCVLIVLFII